MKIKNIVIYKKNIYIFFFSKMLFLFFNKKKNVHIEKKIKMDKKKTRNFWLKE